MKAIVDARAGSDRVPCRGRKDLRKAIKRQESTTSPGGVEVNVPSAPSFVKR